MNSDGTVQAAAVDTPQKKDHIDYIDTIIRLVGLPLRLHQINHYAESYGYGKISDKDISNAIKSKKIEAAYKNSDHVYYAVNGVELDE